MGGGGGKSQTQSSGESHGVTQVILPPWVDKAGQENVAEAGRIAALPYQEYAGTLIPEFSDATQQTLDWMERNAGRYQPMYDEAGNATRALQARGDVGRGNLQDYMNPYVNNVEQRAIANAETSGLRAQQAIQQDASTKRAFGGTR